MAAGDSELTELLKQELNTSTLKFKGRSGGGCISEGKACDTDTGTVFVKINTDDGARTMFDGEAASLDSIGAEGVVRVPKPVKVITLPRGGAAFVMEYLDFKGGLRSKAALLGEQLARLHLSNGERLAREEGKSQSVHKGKGERGAAVSSFGFHVTTCCGYIPQDNQWTATWEELYARKLDQQISWLEKEYNDREARQEWGTLQRKLPKFFQGLHIRPALLHGDLWAGNVAEIDDGPVIFDPASYYGHAEFDLSIASMFGGFPRAFYNSYFKLLPKENGYSNRSVLYELFHNINHWNHFGGGYRHSSMAMLRQLNKMDI